MSQSPIDPIAVVTGFIRATESGDFDAIRAMLHPHVSYENMPITPIVGADAVISAMEMFLAPADLVDWKILRHHVLESVAGTTTVFNERLDRFRIGNGWLELPVAGLFEVDPDGLIVLWRDYFDLGSYQRQLDELAR